jgi:hypothetical protein
MKHVWRLSFLLVLALSSCETGPNVQTDFDRAADWTRYHTYTWIYQAAPRGMNPLAYERVRDGIDRQLQAQGFRPGDPGDFAVAFTIGKRDRVEVTDFGPYGPYYSPGWRGGYWGHSWSGWGGSNVDVRTITEGTLVIDFYDVQTRRPIWHGRATQDIGSGPVDQTTIDQAIVAVLKEFPPHGR